MRRREFLRWLYRVTGGMVAIGVVSELPPLRKINATMFSTNAYAVNGCNPDLCTVSDTCSGKDYCTTADSCQVDITNACGIDKCKLDIQNQQSPFCNTDICTLDKSGSCNIDLCRIDVTTGCTYSDVCATDNCTGSDTCSGDNPPCEGCGSGEGVMNDQTTRREFAKAGLNKALQMLYRFCTIAIFIGLAFDYSHAATVIDARDAIFNPVPSFSTGNNMLTPMNVGPFLRDCDNDGVLEADTNCDNSCAGDPELRDYNNDGTYELPPGTSFEGICAFSCFFIPYNVAITTTGQLTVATSQEVVVFGAMSLQGSGTFNAIGNIDLRTSAWNAGGALVFATNQTGTVDTSQTPVPPGEELPTPIHYGTCQDPLNNPLSIPTMTEWGMLIFMLIAGIGAIFYLKKKQKA